jgi:tetratricopeptide (TPR) repeat protein
MTAWRDQAAATQLVHRALDADPRDPVVLVVHGSLLAGRGEVAQAAEELVTALEVNPRFVPALLDQARLRLAEGRLAEALELAQRAAALTPGRVDVPVVEGAVHMRMQNPGLAEACYDRALAAVGPFVEITRSQLHVLRGEARAAMHRGPEALEDFSAAIDLDRQSVPAYVARSQVFLLSGRFAEARTDAEAALARDPASAVGRRARASALAALIRAEQAQRAASRGSAAVRRRNLQRLPSAAMTCSWNADQITAVQAELGGTEDLVWVARCAGSSEVLRLVALLVTSERLLWCRRVVFGSVVCETASFLAIEDVQVEDDGFTVRPGAPAAAARSTPDAQQPVGRTDQPRGARALGELTTRVRRLASVPSRDPAAPVTFTQVRDGVDVSGLRITLARQDLGLLVQELVRRARWG